MHPAFPTTHFRCADSPNYLRDRRNYLRDRKIYLKDISIYLKDILPHLGSIREIALQRFPAGQHPRVTFFRHLPHYYQKKRTIMKKFLSLAVLLMAALVGFTACSDDESDGVKSLSKTTFTTTTHVSDPIKSGDLTYTVSFNSDSECVMRVESRNMKLLNADKTYSDDVYYGGTYTKNGNTITFNVDCITTEGVANPYSVIDCPETRTFTYNPDTKVLTAESGLELSSTKYAHLECKKYPSSNAITGIKFEDLVNRYWLTQDDNSYNSAQNVSVCIKVNDDGTADYRIIIKNRKNGETLRDVISFDEPITPMGDRFTIGDWLFQFKSFSSDAYMKDVTISDPQGRLFTKVQCLKCS